MDRYRPSCCGLWIHVGWMIRWVGAENKEKMQVRKTTQDVLTWKLQKEHCRRHEFPKKYVIIIFSRRYEVIWKRSVHVNFVRFSRCLCSRKRKAWGGRREAETSEEIRRVFAQIPMLSTAAFLSSTSRSHHVSIFCRQSNLFADCRHPSTKANKDLMRE